MARFVIAPHMRLHEWVAHTGAIALPFSSPGMYRGYARGDGVVRTAIFDEAYRSS